MQRHRVTLVVTAVLAALAIAPATAGAHHGCSKHAKGATIVTKTKEAHVFIKRQRWYGCAAKFGRVRLLPGLDSTEAVRFGDGRVPSNFTLAGQFVAYEQYTLEPAGAETQSYVYIYDLGADRTEYTSIAGSTQPPAEDSVMERLVLKRNGSAAWTARLRGGSDATYEVHRYSKYATVGGRVTMDAGQDLDPESLLLSPDRHTISWTRGGQTKSAELP
jgi:hypothetical protein